MLLDYSHTPVPPNQQKPELATATGSFVDFAFGDCRGSFSGCHRFEVLREREDDSEGEVKIVYSSIACNPMNQEHVFARWLGAFHVLYARVLFWDGVREVLR